ncbi:bifunctional aldehyde dehydrogenase/enoyl-CoA hydratase [Sporotomaculum syntrophicum]|uniref:Bifunctional aldehyde dehydrogenase/enoyl-CoA hydratase n=1 Tax=Sporotomaculum syntrophicum TaxID=182264 RepID=A0A9D3AZ30_9FIRM|nr:MaoC/PaaZ C-terminal domain-containing protein [Sporotomaculum syntrophicum]KAF1085393.1 bifunctional aldehyde dehydrogenase/enoyl-CoA hydratase [Sporotomaculum syntrophicum]
MYFDDFTVGQEFEIESITINKEKMLKFAQDYDPQPIHLDEDFAKKSKFGVVIAPGIMSFMSVWAKFVESNIITQQFIAALSFRVDWFSPVFADDVLKGKATINKLTARNRYNGIVEIRITVTNQEGTLVMDTTTEAVLERRVG